MVHPSKLKLFFKVYAEIYISTLITVCIFAAGWVSAGGIVSRSSQKRHAFSFIASAVIGRNQIKPTTSFTNS